MEVTNQLKKSVWAKGQIVEGFNPDMYRKDPCGAWIVWDKYGVSDSLYGWVIDHIYPRARLEEQVFSEDLINDLRNLRPMQHQNNASKSDDYPSYIGVVTSEGKKNIYKEVPLTVNEATRTLLSQMYKH
ncbi:MAG: DUF1524 domain-containing protein [Bacteroidales bacterium]|nr:DUF1524 domain-containing protein [Bacteroidales bacterium]